MPTAAQLLGYRLIYNAITLRRHCPT